MKKMEVEKLATLKTVLKVLDDYTDRWSSYKPISAKVAQLRALVQAIDTDSQTQRSSRSIGFTTQKKQAFTNLLELAYKTAMKLKDKAIEDGNNLLFDAVNYSRSTLNSGTFADKLGRCQLILAKAIEQAGAMSDYNISPESLATFKTLVEAAKALTLDKDKADTTRRIATSSIASKMRKANAAAAGLDTLIEGFTSEADANFTDAYFGAHKNRHYRGGSKKKPADTISANQEATA